MANIAQVLSWKFNSQPGMRCAMDDSGVLRIVEFPGGIPTQSDQATWATEYDAFAAASNLVTAEATNRIDGDKILRTLFEILFNLENRVRTIEGQPTINRATYRTAWINAYKALT